MKNYIEIDYIIKRTYTCYNTIIICLISKNVHVWRLKNVKFTRLYGKYYIIDIVLCVIKIYMSTILIYCLFLTRSHGYVYISLMAGKHSSYHIYIGHHKTRIYCISVLSDDKVIAVTK